MNRQRMEAIMQRTVLATLVLIGLSSLTPVSADAAPRRVVLDTNVDPALLQPRANRGASAEKRVEAKPVVLNGELRRSTQKGLHVNGTPVLFSALTGFSPALGAGKMPEDALLGRVISIVGRQTRLGFEASLVVRPESQRSTTLTTKGPQAGEIPSESNPNVGVVTDAAPR